MKFEIPPSRGHDFSQKLSLNFDFNVNNASVRHF